MVFGLFLLVLSSKNEYWYSMDEFFVAQINVVPSLRYDKIIFVFMSFILKSFVRLSFSSD